MSDPTLYLYTSLTAGSSHIVTATARIETILKANKLPFRAVDVATDDAARKLWGRRSKGKKLPGLVKYGDIVGDLEQIEEWNEFGELRLVVLSVQDLGGMPATSNPIPATESKTEPEPVTPKPSTIKIQSPTTTKPEEKKDEKAVLALRQVSSEAASTAASKAEQKKEPAKEEAAEKPAPRGHRGSVAAELPDIAPDSPKAAKRPVLIPEMAAVSSANFHAENAEALGLVEHHRGSIISTTDKEEQDKVVREIRASITAEEPSGNLDAIRKQAAEQTGSDTIEEVATPLFEDVNDTKMAAAAEEIETAESKTEEPKTEKEPEIKEDIKESKPEDVKEKEAESKD